MSREISRVIALVALVVAACAPTPSRVSATFTPSSAPSTNATATPTAAGTMTSSPTATIPTLITPTPQPSPTPPRPWTTFELQAACDEFFQAVQAALGTSPRVKTSIGEFQVLAGPRSAGCQASYGGTRDQFSNDGNGTVNDWLIAQGFAPDYHLAADGPFVHVLGYRSGDRVIDISRSLRCADPNAPIGQCPAISAYELTLYQSVRAAPTPSPSFSYIPPFTPAPTDRLAQATLTSPLQQCEQLRQRVKETLQISLEPSASTSGFTIPQTSLLVSGCRVWVQGRFADFPIDRLDALSTMSRAEGFEFMPYPYPRVNIQPDLYTTFRRGSQVMRIDISFDWSAPCPPSRLFMECLGHTASVEWYEL